MIRLKKLVITIFFLSFSFYLGVSAQVSVSGVVISEIQAEGASATSEFIELHNQTNSSIDVTGWKVLYVSASGSTTTLKATLDGVLVANGYYLLSTTESGLVSDQIFSNGLALSGGHIVLQKPDETEVDRLGWGTAVAPEKSPAISHAKSHSLQRFILDSGIFQDTNDNSLDFFDNDTPYAQGGGVVEVVDPPIDEPVEYLPVEISEFLPDPVSPQTDAEDEFIELYNPNEDSVNLKDYVIKTGNDSQYGYTFGDVDIEAGGYLTIYSKDSGLVLSNTSGAVRIYSPDDELFDQTTYDVTESGQSYIKDQGVWKLTTEPTPDKENILSLPIGDGEEVEETELQPCRPDQYRNPETNRCKLIETASQLQECASDQYRSPETNRCRSLSTTTSSLTPCKQGQYRSPETNRCRSLASNTSKITACKAGYERNIETNRCRKIVSVASPEDSLKQFAAIDPVRQVNWPIIAIVGGSAVMYGLYESRFTVRNFVERARGYIKSRRQTSRGP